MDIPLPTNTPVQLTLELVSQLRHQYQQFLQPEYQQPLINGQYIYLLSTKFIREWQRMIQPLLATNFLVTGNNQTVMTPQMMNFQLIKSYFYEFDQVELNPNLIKNHDFRYCNKKRMKIFDKYSGVRITRRIYQSYNQKNIQLYPIKFKFFFMSSTWVSLLRSKQQDQLLVRTSLGYENQTIGNLSQRLKSYAKKDPRNRKLSDINSDIRIYIALGLDIKQYTNQLIDAYSYRYTTSWQEIDQKSKINQLDVPKQDFVLVVELKENQWVFQKPLNKDPQQNYMNFSHHNPAHAGTWSNNDTDYWSNNFLHESQNQQSQIAFKPNSKKGLVGLTNLGNTCYMNSALQCMIHTTQLTQYFKKKQYIKQINQENPIGSHGKIAKSYAKFIQKTLYTQYNSIAPKALRSAIGRTKQIFSGSEEQDSQQFLLFLLDIIHEDLNRVITKKNTAPVESNGRQDQIVAKESWSTYLKRNQSIIIDLFGGQYRSQVKCLNCNKISVTFDPYLTFAVPIPQTKTINIYYLYSNYKEQPMKLKVASKNNLVRQLKQDTAQKLRVSKYQMVFVISSFYGPVRIVDDEQSVDRLINQKKLDEHNEEKQLFCMEFERQQLKNLSQKQFLIFQFTTIQSQLYSDQIKSLTFKRPFPMPIQNLKGHHLYQRILTFTESLSIKQDQKYYTLEFRKKLITEYRDKKLFKIYMLYGDLLEERQKKYSHDEKILVENDTDIQHIIQQYKNKIEFEVFFQINPLFNWNSYRTYIERKSSFYQRQDVEPNDSFTLQQCLEQMKKPQKLLPGNQVYCSHCSKFTSSQKKMQLYKASEYLIVHLRRFKDCGYHQKSKNYVKIQFPLQLNLQNFILSPKIPAAYFQDEEEVLIKPQYWKGISNSASTKYKLYGVVNHHGSLSSGHYTAFAQYEDTWYQFNDQTVSKVDCVDTAIVTKSAYLLFYKRLP